MKRFVSVLLVLGFMALLDALYRWVYLTGLQPTLDPWLVTAGATG